MEKYDEYTEMGLRAMKRAAKKVYEDARKNNIKINRIIINLQFYAYK